MMVDDGCIEKQKARMSVKSWRDWVRLGMSESGVR